MLIFAKTYSEIISPGKTHPEWFLDIPGSSFPRIPAAVPGSVYHDLLTAGQIPDPFYRDNENEALKIMDHDFVYSRSFTVPAELLRNDAAILRCENLDTLAEIAVPSPARPSGACGGPMPPSSKAASSTWRSAP